MPEPSTVNRKAPVLPVRDSFERGKTRIRPPPSITWVLAFKASRRSSGLLDFPDTGVLALDDPGFRLPGPDIACRDLLLSRAIRSRTCTAEAGGLQPPLVATSVARFV